MNNYFNFAAISSVAIMVWGYLSGFATRIRSFFIINVKLNGYAKDAFFHMLWKDFTRSKFGDRCFGGFSQHVIDLKKVQKIGYEDIPMQPLLYWKGWRPILIGSLCYQSSPDPLQGTCQITFIRGTFNLEELMITSFDLLNEKNITKINNKRFCIKKIYGKYKVLGGDLGYQKEPTSGNSIKDLEELQSYRLIKYKHNQLGIQNLKDPLSSFEYDEEVHSFINKIKNWYDSKEWFLERGIPWRTGALFYGNPGSGKSSLVRVLGQMLDLPIWIFDLSTLNNKEFNEEWQEMLSMAPAIFLIEDIDNCFDKRTSLKNKDLTFNCLINAISGVEPSDGIITIITTNNLDKIDGALGVPNERGESSRPGRLDFILHLSIMNKKCRLKLAQKILSECPEYIDEVMKKSEGFTAAQMQNYCAEIALREYWNKINQKTY